MCPPQQNFSIYDVLTQPLVLHHAPLLLQAVLEMGNRVVEVFYKGVGQIYLDVLQLGDKLRYTVSVANL